MNFNDGDKEYLIGVEYFCGWWRKEPNKYKVIGDTDWRINFPERIPLLGCYNDNETMEAEIQAAKDNKIDFFLMLWYADAQNRNVNGEYLNRCFDDFMLARNHSGLSFAIEFCNHPPFEILDDELWENSVELWVSYMQHPAYLKIGGRPLFKIHGLHYFLEQNNFDMQRAKARISYLKEKCKIALLDEPIIGGGVMCNGLSDIEEKALELVDFTATYMDVPNLPLKEELYPYEMLVKIANEGRCFHSKTNPKPYLPYVPAGWDPRPWGDARPSFKLPNQVQWSKALKDVKNALDKNEMLGIKSDNFRQKIFTIYAWNEFGEGGIVAPTVGEGFMKLSQINEIF